jgi:WD40 repeat protein
MKLSKVLRGVALCCAILAACSGLSMGEVIEQTPSSVPPTATLPPTATFTPPATFTPVYSPTPEPLPPTYIELCEKAFGKGVREGTIQPPILLLSIVDYENRGWGILGSIEVRKMTEVRTLACVRETRERAFTYTDGADGYRIRRTVRLVEVESGDVIAAETYVGSEPPSVKFKPGDEYGSTPSIKILEGFSDQQEDLNIIRLDVTGPRVAVSPDGKFFVHLAAGSETSTAIVFRDVNTRQVVNQFESSYYPDTIEFTPDGKFILTTSSSNSQNTLWDISSGTAVQSFPGSHGTLSPDGKRIATVTEDADTLMPKLVLWDVSSGNEVKAISDIFEYPWFEAVRFSPDGKTLAFDSISLVIWNMENWQVERAIDSGGAEILAFSPDGGILATASIFSEAVIELWNPATGEHIRTIGPIGNPDIPMRVRAISFSPDGRYLAAGLDDGTARVWETTTWLEIHTYYGNFGTVESVAFSPDGGTLYAGATALIKIFDLTVP